MDGRRPWSSLPADLLRDISARIYAPAEFVHFHVVCKHWRASHDPLSRTFLPWLLSPPSTHPRFRCIFSQSSYHVLPLPPTAAARSLVSAADGTAVRYLTTVERHRPTLHGPLTGKLTRLPVFTGVLEWAWAEETPHGVVYGDGAIFLYSIGTVGAVTQFTAGLLHPGSDVWTAVARTLDPPKHCEFCAAYHGGKIMLTVEATLWRIVTPEPEGADHATSDVLVPRPPLPRREREHYQREYSYVLMSRGKLLWVSLKINLRYTRDVKAEHKMWMTVHELRLQQGGEKERTRWIKRDTCILDDRVLFLGTPISFAVEASRFSGRHGGGCAFFVFHDINALPLEMFGIFSYSLVSKKVNFFERLPRGWKDERCTWHVIQSPYCSNSGTNEGSRSESADSKLWVKHSAFIPGDITSLVSMWLYVIFLSV